MKTDIHEIIFVDEEAYKVVAEIVRSVSGIKEFCTLHEPIKTYPGNDLHFSMRVQCRDKDLHTIRWMAHLSYKVAAWK